MKLLRKRAFQPVYKIKVYFSIRYASKYEEKFSADGSNPQPLKRFGRLFEIED